MLSPRREKGEVGSGERGNHHAGLQPTTASQAHEPANRVARDEGFDGDVDQPLIYVAPPRVVGASWNEKGGWETRGTGEDYGPGLSE